MFMAINIPNPEFDLCCPSLRRLLWKATDRPAGHVLPAQSIYMYYQPNHVLPAESIYEYIGSRVS